jgi:transposase-like protein
MKYVKCGCDKLCENVINARVQKYKCKNCGYNFTKGSVLKPIALKRLALQIYLEGLGFLSIGRMLNISHVSAYNGIRSFGQKAEELRSENEIFVSEIDEMYSYISSKKNPCWIWISVDRFGKKFINFIIREEVKK